MKLTLCMIARDEEKLLGGCLESARPAVDRIVVVDTGSSDRTREIARAAGALVIEHAWNDDFAAARNAALAHVKDGFILVLDADERLTRDARRALRRTLAANDLDCGLMPLHNAATLDASPRDVLAGRARRGEPVLLPRLLRRTADLEWQGIVHESVSAWVARGKRRVARVEAPIVHYGAVPDLRAALRKDERNRRLLERRVELDPSDVIARAYLARELERAGDALAALEQTDEAWRLWSAARERGESVDVVQLATLRGFLLIRGGRLDDALAMLAVARREQAAHPNLALLEGLAHERRALRVEQVGELEQELAAAERCFQACVEQRGAISWVETMPGATGWTAWTRLGTIHLIAGRGDEALADFERALEQNPGHAEAELGRAEALCLIGDARSALAVLEPLLVDPAPDAWILFGLACHALGARADAEHAATEAARRCGEANPLASHRVELLRHLTAPALPEDRALASALDDPRATAHGLNP